jgi:transcriptional regulator with XRE-family HTH domain
MSGQNQKDFSKQCGLDRTYFGRVERGERNLTFSSLCQICAGLNCDIATVTEGIPCPAAPNWNEPPDPTKEPPSE